MLDQTSITLDHSSHAFGPHSAWPTHPREDLEHELSELLLGFAHVRRSAHCSERFDVAVHIGRLQAQLRSFVRRVAAKVAEGLLERSLTRNAAHRAFDSCHRLDVTWLQLCELRDEIAASATLDSDARHGFDLRLARLADRCGNDARTARASMDWAGRAA